nr:hypothetical protein [Nocardiopsis valliformis]
MPLNRWRNEIPRKEEAWQDVEAVRGPGSVNRSERATRMGNPELEAPAFTRGRLHLHLFVTTQQQLRSDFGELRDHLNPRGMLWVSWPKGGRLGTDLDMKKAIAIGYDLGMVESTCLRVDELWAGLKFTRPKPGKIYRNSYDTLPQQRSEEHEEAESPEQGQ